MLDLAQRGKPPLPGDSPGQSPATLERAPWRPGASAEPAVVRDPAQLPMFVGVLTQKGQRLFDEGSASQLAALLLTDRRSVAIVRAVGAPVGLYLTLGSRLRQAGHPVDDREVFASTTVVQQVNGIGRADVPAESVVVRGQDHSALRLHWDDLLAQAVSFRASDIHLEIRTEEQSRVRLRIGGDLIDLQQFTQQLGIGATRTLQDMVGYLYTSMLADRSHSRGDYSKEADLSGQLAEIKVVDATGKARRISGRVQTIQASGRRPMDGPLAGIVPGDLILRLLYSDDRSIPSLEALGYLPSQARALRNAVARRHGLTSISGRVGNGKSTALRSVYADTPPHWKKYTLEDPVEYWHPNASSVGVQRHSGAEGWDSFGLKLLAFKRGDLDALLLGEVRDAPSMAAVRDITFSGHPVFTTVHADSALGQLARMTTPEMGLSHTDLADPAFLNTLVHQALVATICPECCLRGAEAHAALGTAYLEQIESLFRVDAGRMCARNPRGCARCQADSLPALYGYSGRTVAAEWWTPDMDDRALIRARDELGLLRKWRSARAADFDSEETAGKTAMEVGVYKALIGQVDPRSIEDRFRPFSLYEVIERGGGARSSVIGLPRRL